MKESLNWQHRKKRVLPKPLPKGWKAALNILLLNESLGNLDQKDLSLLNNIRETVIDMELDK